MEKAKAFYALWEPNSLNTGAYRDAQNKLDKSAKTRFAAGVFAHIRKNGSAKASAIAELVKVLNCTTFTHPRKVLPVGLANWASIPELEEEEEEEEEEEVTPAPVKKKLRRELSEPSSAVVAA